jgi:hypothetical protein
MTRTDVPPSYRNGRALTAAALTSALIGCGLWSATAGIPTDILAWCERIATLGWFWTW